MKNRELHFTAEALAALRRLESDPKLRTQLEQLRWELGMLEINPRHRLLHIRQVKGRHGLRRSKLYLTNANSLLAVPQIFFMLSEGEEGRVKVRMVEVIYLQPNNS